MEAEPIPNRDTQRDTTHNQSTWTFERAADVVTRGAKTVRSALTLAMNALDRVDGLVRTVSRDSRQVANDATLFWVALSTSIAKLQQTARATPRVMAALTEVGRLAAVYRLAYLKAGFLAASSAERYLATVHTREGGKLRRFCERQGGGLLKVGQVLSTRGDLLPAAFIGELAGLQDSAEPPPMAELEAALDGWWPDWHERFALDAPLAAASLAAVYRGRLVDGTPVAVKVQRPGIERVLAEDRTALDLIARLFNEARPAAFANIDVRPILAEVGKSLSEEVDFAAEHAMSRRFEAALPPTLCRVPGLRLEPHPRVLVMDLVDGLRLPEALREPGSAAPLLTDLARVFAHALLVHGLVHGDPHPGNVLVLASESPPRLALLDFGSAVVLTEPERKAYLGLLVGLMGRQRAPLVQALSTLGFTTDGTPAEPSSLEALADALCSMPRPADLKSIDPREELERGLSLMRGHGHLQMPGHMIRVGRALGTLGGLFLTHRDELDNDRLDLPRLLMEVVLEASRR